MTVAERAGSPPAHGKTNGVQWMSQLFAKIVYFATRRCVHRPVRASCVVDGRPSARTCRSDPSDTDSVLAWQFGVGVGYALSDRATLQMGYRLQATSELTFSGSNEMALTRATTDLRAHFLEIAIRFEL